MNWGNFWNLNLPSNPEVWNVFSWQHFMMLFICLAITFSLYVFPKQYAYLSRNNYFLYGLVVIQLLLMIFLRTIQILNIPKYQFANENWTNVFPLNFCAITQILSIIIIFWKNNKFFSTAILFPIFGSWLTIIMPSEKEALATNIDQLRFYEFFLSHYLSFFIFFFLYLYGKRQYLPTMWKVSILSLFSIAMFDYILNVSFGTDFMFMGPNNPVGIVDFRAWLPNLMNGLGNFLNTMFVIIVMGFGGIGVVYVLLNYLVKPLYANSGQKKLQDSWIIVLSHKLVTKFYRQKLSD